MLCSTRSCPESWGAVPLRLWSWSSPWLHPGSNHTRVTLWPNEDDRPIRLFDHPAAIRKRANLGRWAGMRRLSAFRRSRRIEVALSRRPCVWIVCAVWISIRIVTGIAGPRRWRIDPYCVVASLRLLRRHALRRGFGLRLLRRYLVHFRRIGWTRSRRRVVR